MKSGGLTGTGPQSLPYTSRSKKVIELAMVEARDLNHAHVGTGHLLIALLREEKGMAAQAIAALGVTVERARSEMLRLFGSEARIA